MDKSSAKERLDIGAAALLSVLCMLWGFNAVAIKVSNVDRAPLWSRDKVRYRNSGTHFLDEAEKDESISRKPGGRYRGGGSLRR
jgi:hypothetical protein